MKIDSVWILFLSLTGIFVAYYFFIKRNDLVKIESFVKSERNLVVLILGQSNAANYCQELNPSEENIFMYFEDELYVARDPILGASGEKGSIWIPVFNELLILRDLDSVLIVNVAQGSSSVLDWHPDGKFHSTLYQTFAELKEKNLEPDLILWQQGEQDNLNGTSKEAYKSTFKRIQNEIGLCGGDIPILMSITSYHPKSDSPINSEIRGAQKELIQENDGLFSGPDTDRYIEESRYDGIHFSSNGMILVAKDWTESIDRFLDSKTKSKTLNI